MTRDNGNSCLQFSPLFKFLVQFNTLFFKTVQFCSFQFETKLLNKFNYNLYIHVKIIFLNLYIKSLHLNIQITLFFYKCKKLKKLKISRFDTCPYTCPVWTRC